MSGVSSNKTWTASRKIHSRGLRAWRSPRAGSAGLNQAVGGPFESSDVDTLHLHHRLEGALGAGRIGVAEKGRKLARHEPTQHLCAASLAQQGFDVPMD